MKITDAQIKHMVQRFLGWKVPETFNPDGGVSFERYGNKDTPHQYDRLQHLSGTNIFDADQAEAMVRHMIKGMPEVCWLIELRHSNTLYYHTGKSGLIGWTSIAHDATRYPSELAARAAVHGTVGYDKMHFAEHMFMTDELPG